MLCKKWRKTQNEPWTRWEESTDTVNDPKNKSNLKNIRFVFRFYIVSLISVLISQYLFHFDTNRCLKFINFKDCWGIILILFNNTKRHLLFFLAFFLLCDETWFLEWFWKVHQNINARSAGVIFHVNCKCEHFITLHNTACYNFFIYSISLFPLLSTFYQKDS